jgi:hypothetical protein
MESYIDADHAGDVDTLRSTTGAVTFMNDGPIQWMSKRQPEVSASGPAASEFKALYFGAQEILFLRNLSLEMNIPQPGPTIINEDCQPAIDFSHNPVNMSRMKGTQLQYLAVREYLVNGQIHLSKISTEAQVADMFTKPLARSMHQLHTAKVLRRKTFTCKRSVEESNIEDEN